MKMFHPVISRLYAVRQKKSKWKWKLKQNKITWWLLYFGGGRGGRRWEREWKWRNWIIIWQSWFESKNNEKKIFIISYCFSVFLPRFTNNLIKVLDRMNWIELESWNQKKQNKGMKIFCCCCCCCSLKLLLIQNFWNCQ